MGVMTDKARVLTRREWREFENDLLELELAGAIGGVRAIVTERLRQVRAGHTVEADRAGSRDTSLILLAGNKVSHAPTSPDGPLHAYAAAGALLAAEMDRIDGPVPVG